MSRQEHREQLAARARFLRDNGLLQREIAVELGVSSSYASELLNDPTGAKARARKDRYRGTCKTCGASTTGCNGAASAPDTCIDCMAQRLHDERYWTPERIIEAIQTWHRERGRPPLSTEWLKAERDRRFPSVGKVQGEFGNWRAGIEAAGFQCVEPGRYERTPEWRAACRRVDRDLVIRLRKQGLSYDEIAREAHCSRANIWRILRAEAPHLMGRPSADLQVTA